jgi:2-Cys peroxiredoxin 5
MIAYRASTVVFILICTLISAYGFHGTGGFWKQSIKYSSRSGTFQKVASSTRHFSSKTTAEMATVGFKIPGKKNIYFPYYRSYITLFFNFAGDLTLHEGNPGNKVTSSQLFAGKKVVIFGVPGAFTPGCHKTHLPGYIADFAKFKEKGVDDIICVAVNDAFVCDAWKNACGADGKVRVIADTTAELTKALGMEIDLSAVLGGVRSKRYSAYVVDSEVKVMNPEPDGTGLTCSLANNLLSQIQN